MIDEGFEEIVDGGFKGYFKKDNDKYQNLINSRKPCNLMILDILKEMTLTHPDIRFGQMVCILKLYMEGVDFFNEESWHQLERALEEFKKYKLKNMNTIIINGKVIKVNGNNVSIVNNKVFVDGKEIETDELKGEVTIKWEGDLANLECPNVNVKGNIQGNVDSHNVEVTGNIGGNITSHNIEVGGNVQGDVKGHNVDVQGNVYGTKKTI